MNKFYQLLKQAKVIDLSHGLDENSPVWPGNMPFQRELQLDYAQGCRVYNYCQAAGTGTHIDAPSHFISGGRSIAELSLTELLAPACVIDVRNAVAANSDYAISPADIITWEQQFGSIPVGAVVLALTGWSARWFNPQLYLNMDEQGFMHFPGFSREAAELLVERKVVGVGIDTLSPDPGLQLDFAVHRILLGTNKYLIENLTNLEAIPAIGSYLCALPLKIAGGTEAGARVIALYGDIKNRS